MQQEKHHSDRNAGHQAGRLFIISAPSGAGKTTLCRSVRRHLPLMAYSISYTTRLPRSFEQHGRDYFFISKEEFKKGICNGQWAEWAEVHDNYYGTSAHWIKKTLAAGKDILMDIDVQGARQIIEQYPTAVTIFIMPPTLEELKRRLLQRGSDAKEIIELRLINARQEMSQKDFYQHIIVNDVLEEAIQELLTLIRRCLASQQ